MSARVKGYENYRLAVFPRRLGDVYGASVNDSFFGDTEDQIEALYRERCQEIKQQIERLHNVGVVHVQFDTTKICDHCGADWTESSETYNGGCCQKDEDEHSEDAQ